MGIEDEFSEDRDGENILQLVPPRTEEISDGPRVLIILHPNPSCMEIVLNDRMFNREKYRHSRDTPAEGKEKVLLDFLGLQLIGIERVQAGKNILSLDIQSGILLREFIPLVITAIKEWGSNQGEPYTPEIYVDNRRYDVPPTYSDDGWGKTSPGVRAKSGSVDIGVPYKIWTAKE